VVIRKHLRVEGTPDVPIAHRPTDTRVVRLRKSAGPAYAGRLATSGAGAAQDPLSAAAWHDVG
jgi:hypothetical protein